MKDLDKIKDFEIGSEVFVPIQRNNSIFSKCPICNGESRVVCNGIVYICEFCKDFGMHITNKYETHSSIIKCLNYCKEWKIECEFQDEYNKLWEKSFELFEIFKTKEECDIYIEKFLNTKKLDNAIENEILREKRYKFKEIIDKYQGYLTRLTNYEINKDF